MVIFLDFFVLTFPVFHSVVFLVYNVIVFIRYWLAEKQKQKSSVMWEKITQYTSDTKKENYLLVVRGELANNTGLAS